MESIAVIVVLYNPDLSEVNKQRESFNERFSPIVYVDNSDKPYLFDSSDLFQGENIIYINNNGNKGIAHALNRGCDYLISQGYSWVLTLDQDSILPPNMGEAFLKARDQLENERVALISPKIKYYRKQILEEKKEVPGFEFINIAITSGSYINLKAYQKINKFDEALFIDQVDTDFCLRLSLEGYLLMQLNDVILDHQLGDTYEIKLRGKHFCFVSNHNYIRKYYLYRNTLFLIQKYKSDFPKEIKTLKNKLYIILFKIIFFENDKIRKLKSIYYARKDFNNKKFGKLML